jgi:hypothetical protein
MVSKPPRPTIDGLSPRRALSLRISKPKPVSFGWDDRTGPSAGPTPKSAESGSGDVWCATDLCELLIEEDLLLPEGGKRHGSAA